MGKITGGFLTTFVSCVTICMSAAAQEDSLKVEERRDSITEARITAEKYAEEASGSRTGHRPPAYEAWKERCLQHILDKLETVRPHIRADMEFCLASSPLTIRDFYGTKEGALYGYNRDCKNMALSQLPIATKVRNLLLTGQNINLHGICGVPLTAIETAECIVGNGNIVKKINEEYDRRKQI